jgi:hypothetical protein
MRMITPMPHHNPSVEPRFHLVQVVKAELDEHLRAASPNSPRRDCSALVKVRQERGDRSHVV